MRNCPKFYSEKEISWIKTNYPLYGSNYCANFLNVTLEQIRNKIKNLKINKKEDIKIELEQFKTIKTKEVAYILGLIWADGHINIDKRHISISIIDDDMKQLKNIFMSTGKWNYKIIDMSKYGNYKNKV